MASNQRPWRYFDQPAETGPWSVSQAELEGRLRQTVELVLERSPAYGQIYGQAGVVAGSFQGLGDLDRLPLMRMSDLVARQERDPPFGGFETVPAEQFHRIYINPGFIWQPGESGYQQTSLAEALCGGGILPGDRVLNTFSYHLWPYAHMLDDSLKMLGATVLPSGTGNAFMQVRVMQKLKVSAYMGTPSFLMTLAQRAEAMGLDPAADLALEAAVVGAEMLPESLRRRLQEKLGITVRQSYATVYLGCLGYECQAAQGLHVPQGMLVEVVDPATGQAQPPGKAGEVVASNLSPAYPMLRLATGDLSMWMEGQCSCGRTSPRLKGVLGRMDQAVKVRGTFVHPWQLDELFAARPEVFKYQAEVSRHQDQDLLTLKVELTEDVGRELALCRMLEQDLREFLTVKGQVEVVPRGTIPDFHGKILDRRKWD
ncbi:MAG: AMP-binding protein [Desulfarculaceae bacterium]|nr:AMP-binding protein [Desulfarculaceae bacterium]MCF8071714.1 AMP-binding protein [Desulfarculaceae bacterium]MCF8102439.1 AMP-binding protein [Desulfarculaceae bacterium]MCF8116781.1 AMP-binding protein [Desulfarculaceae bacterium]